MKQITSKYEIRIITKGGEVAAEPIRNITSEWLSSTLKRLLLAYPADRFNLIVSFDTLAH